LEEVKNGERKTILTTLSPKNADLAQAAAIQNEYFVYISIMKEEHCLTQAREDGIAEARAMTMHEESKQKLAREKEINGEKRQAQLRETAIQLEIAKEDRRQLEKLARKVPSNASRGRPSKELDGEGGQCKDAGKGW
jgi:ectoine hydroxylase-related dioxygenase (phytanoyl-CoA dioxygenase family)